MGRSTRAQADENRARIVEIASGLFRAHGVEKVGIADVMRAAGMTPGGFYKHFESKEALATEACALAFRNAASRWKAVASKARSQDEDVSTALVNHYLKSKPAELTCPMIALAEDALRGESNNALQIAYGEGVQLLLNTFLEESARKGGDVEKERLMRKFSGMVGANLLGRSAPAGRDLARTLVGL